MTLLNFAKITHPYAQDVQQTVNAVTVVASDSTPLLHSGIVELTGVRFDLHSKEGLFSYTQFETSRVIDDVTYEPFYNQGYFIVVDPINPDPFTFLSAMCRMMLYGHEDRLTTISERKAALRQRRLMLQCGDQCAITSALLDDLGITWRQVHLVTAETPTNFDDGHVALEVFIQNRWVFIDMAADSYYIDSNGVPLSMYEIIQAGVENCTQARLSPVEFSAGIPEPVTAGSPTSTMHFNVRPYLDVSLSSDALYKEWARRVWQIPGILDPNDNLIYYYLPEGTEDREDYLLALSAQNRVISLASWLAKFSQN